MQIKLMRYVGETERVIKSGYIKGSWTCDGTLKEDTDILNPIILIEKNIPPQDNYYNYAYIEDFKRYYYIDKIEAVHNNMWRVKMVVDPLYTYAQNILNSKCIIDKVEEKGNSNVYINDGSFVMDSHKFNQVKQFPSGLSDSGYNILICAGGS